MNKDYRDKAEPISEEIIRRVTAHVRYKMKIGMGDDDFRHLKNQIKSIIVQHLYKENKKSESIE